MTLLQVRDVHKDWMTVTWQPPKDDGGSEIKYYIVEKQDQVRLHSCSDFWHDILHIACCT